MWWNDTMVRNFENFEKNENAFDGIGKTVAADFF